MNLRVIHLPLLVIPLTVLVFTVKAVPLYSEIPASTYLVDYADPFPVDYDAYDRSMSAISGTLTNTIQIVAGWQLKRLRKNWIKLIKVVCYLTPKPPKTAKNSNKNPDKNSNKKKAKCKAIKHMPFPVLRENPRPFDLSEDLDLEEYEYPEMFIPEFVSRIDAGSLANAPDITDVSIPETIPAVFDTDHVAEAKSTQILTSAANFQMSQWIWRWNIILCLVNPSCPHVNIPAIKGKSRIDYPSAQVADMEMLRAFNPYNGYSNW